MLILAPGEASTCQRINGRCAAQSNKPRGGPDVIVQLADFSMCCFH
jgi:hypothetical protein